MQTLENIVASAQAGNLEAFSTLVTRFQNMAFATAFAMLDNAQLAEDVAQEAFFGSLHPSDSTGNTRSIPWVVPHHRCAPVEPPNTAQTRANGLDGCRTGIPRPE